MLAEEEDRRAFETSKTLLTASGSILALFMVAFAFLYETFIIELRTKILLLAAPFLLIISTILSVFALLYIKMEAKAIGRKNWANRLSAAFLIGGLIAILTVIFDIVFGLLVPS